MKNRLLTIVLAFLPLMSWGQGTTDPQPYARLAEDGNNNLVLTFYYNLDKNDSDFGIGPFTSASDRGWHSSRANIKEVVFDESFASYDGLSSMNMWFYQMSGLTKVTGISNLNTANVTSLRSTFNGCSSLTTLDLSSLNTSEVKEMNFMFDGCSSLTDLKVGFSTENVTTMANMFLGCSSLTTLDLSTFNTANVKSNMDYMFSSCSALTTIYVSDLWTTENVTSGNEMFNACQSLVGGQGTTFSTSHRGLDYAHIDGGTANPGYFTNGTAIIEFADAKVKEICIDNWDTNGDGELSTVEAAAVTSLGKKFSGTTITSFDELQYFRGLTVLDEGEFSNCPNLASVIVPEGVTSIGYYGFHDCPLASVTLPSTLTSIGGGAFEGCEKLTSITIPAGVTELSRRVLCGCSSLTSIVLPTSLTTIGESALEGCVSLHEIDIPESVTELGPNAINNTGLTSVTIPAGVTSISERAFMGSAALTSVTSQIVNPYAIPDDVFSEYVYQNAPLFVPTGSVDAYKNTDGWKQFMYILAIGDTLRLPYAVLSDNNTVLTFYYDDQKAARGGIAIGSYGPANYEPWYENRTTLTTAVFDESFANDTTLTSTAYWFHECIKLTEIKGLEYLKTDKVTDMRNMFYGCSKLTTLDVSHFKTGNVTNMNLMFYYCSGLTSLDVKGFNTENVTDMGSMFNNCSGLKSLDISSFKTEKVKNMIQMFYQCYNLTTIYVGNGWSTASVTADYGYHMFTDCTALVGGMGTTYDENHVDFTYAHIDGGPSNPGYFTRSGDAPYTEPEPYAVLSENNTVLMFYYDEKKTERNGMSVGPFAAETDRGWDEYKGNINTAIFDDSFANCSTITSTAYWFASCYNSLTIQGLNNLKTDNVTDMTMMFHSTWLKDVDVSGFNTSKVTSMRNMFSACSMSSLDVSNFNTENVIDFNGMFSSNSHLTSLDLKNFNTANATSLRAMFSGCTQLTNIDLSSFNTANVTDMNNMFSSCTNLQHLDLSHFNTDKVRDIRRMFLDCRNLTSLDISSLKTDSVLSMEMLFENCAKLESLDLSSFNTKDIWEMRYMFDGCSNLKTIYVSSEWNTGKVSSGENMFRNCTNLVGGKGTTYDANHVDYTYARIDGGPSNPGYFTDKNAQADDGLELYAIDVESEMKSNETFMPTQSVKMTLGNDSEWSTNNDLAPELGGELKFDANIYYPGIYNKNYAFVSSVVGTNNPAAGPLVDGMSTGSSYKPRWRNLPESGAYFIFESEQDGSLIVPIRINPNKPLYVTDDAGVPLIAYQIKDQDGVTVALDANSSTAEKTNAFLSLNVSKNQKYYIFCKGSKPRVGGYIFAPHTIDIDPATTAAALDSLLAEPVDATFDSNGVLSVGGGTTMADALEYVGGRAEVAKTITAIVWNSTASLTNDDLKGLDNPNMLIYVKDAAFAPANRDNVVIGDFAKNIVLTDVESGNNNFYCPQAFTAEMISYTHEYRQQTEIGVARGWETIALPFTVQTIMHEKWGGIVPFGNSNSGANFWLRQMTSNGLQRATKIEANVPYIISMPNNETYDAPNNLAGRVTFSSQDALVPMTEYTSVHMAVENGMLMFVPCFQTTQAHDMIYALNVGETRGNHPEGSVFEANYRDVRPFEAFTVHEGGNKPAPQFILVFDLNEAGFTGIENVRSHMCDGRSDVWYDLNGRRLQQKPTQKGVYLNNRCKVIIR